MAQGQVHLGRCAPKVAWGSRAKGLNETQLKEGGRITTVKVERAINSRCEQNWKQENEPVHQGRIKDQVEHSVKIDLGQGAHNEDREQCVPCWSCPLYVAKNQQQGRCGDLRTTRRDGHVLSTHLKEDGKKVGEKGYRSEEHKGGKKLRRRGKGNHVFSVVIYNRGQQPIALKPNGLQGKWDPLNVFINKVLLEHSHTQSLK